MTDRDSATKMARPLSVTVAVALVWIQALVTLISGIAFIIANDETLIEEGLNADRLELFGWLEVLLAIGIAAIAILLSAGSRFALGVVSLLMAIRVGMSIWGVIVLFGTPWFWFSIAAGLFAVLMLFLLWNRDARAFFA